MTKRYLAGAVVGPLADMPAHADSLHGGMEQPATEMYIAIDSAEIYEFTGSGAAIKVGDIASASAAYPGVATDAADGLAVTGNVDAATYTLGGDALNTVLFPGVVPDGADGLTVTGAVDAAGYTVAGDPLDTVLFAGVVPDGADGLTVTGAVATGTGIGAFGVTPPATQPTTTLTTSTITDAAALAAIHALIDIINGTGQAAITEA